MLSQLSYAPSKEELGSAQTRKGPVGPLTLLHGFQRPMAFGGVQGQSPWPWLAGGDDRNRTNASCKQQALSRLSYVPTNRLSRTAIHKK